MYTLIISRLSFWKSSRTETFCFQKNFQLSLNKNGLNLYFLNKIVVRIKKRFNVVQGFKVRDRNIFLNIQPKIETLQLIYDRNIGKTAKKNKNKYCSSFWYENEYSLQKKKSEKLTWRQWSYKICVFCIFFLLHFFNILLVLFYIV